MRLDHCVSGQFVIDGSVPCTCTKCCDIAFHCHFDDLSGSVLFPIILPLSRGHLRNRIILAKAAERNCSPPWRWRRTLVPGAK